MNVMLFDVQQHTHLPGYLRYLIEFWNASDFQENLVVVVARTFLHEHADVVQLAERAPRRNIQLVGLTRAEQDARVEAEKGYTTPTFVELLRDDAPQYAAFQDWELFCRYADRFKVTRAFILYLDHYLPLFAKGVEAPVPLAGIYFGPSFHYGLFEDAYTRAQLEPAIALREKFALAHALRNPKLEQLFFLDPFAAVAARKFPFGAKAAYLPDPVRAAPVPRQEVEALRAELGIEAGRKVFLLLGELTPRKGMRELFDAVARLGQETARRICIVLAGRTGPLQQAELQKQCALLRAELPVQIAERYAFIPHAKVAAYFQLADVVLLPYPKHNGMSGVLLLAAAYQKPVLSSTCGLMGEMTRQYKLGLTVDVTQSGEMACALTRCATEDAKTLGDLEQMRDFAAQHDADLFASMVFQSLHGVIRKSE